MRIYRDIIKSAWHTLWHYAWLWPFGLLAALAGNGGEYGGLVSAVDRIAQQGNLLTAVREAMLSHKLNLIGQGLQKSFEQAPASITATLFLLAVALLLVVWLIIVSQAALIRAASAIHAGEPISLTKAAMEGNQHFWPIFALNLLARFATWLLLGVAILPFLISYLARGGVAEFDTLIIISFLVFVPLATIISFIIKYAAIAVVLERQPWWLALERGVGLFFRNWLVSLEMAAILFGINLILSAVVYSLIANSLLSVPVTFVLQGVTLATVLKFLPQLILLVAAGAWYSTFQYAAWTILFRRLQEGQVTPKLLRAADDIPNYLAKWFSASPKSLPPPKPARR
ncbi:MAG: hypothetical protein Q8P77_01115 [Candidatus Veblenbacteria bacterium]|nr:hypothetical protein [Candidatus Veblenbacteria bacterium]